MVGQQGYHLDGTGRIEEALRARAVGPCASRGRRQRSHDRHTALGHVAFRDGDAVDATLTDPPRNAVHQDGEVRLDFSLGGVAIQLARIERLDLGCGEHGGLDPEARVDAVEGVAE